MITSSRHSMSPQMECLRCIDARHYTPCWGLMGEEPWMNEMHHRGRISVAMRQWGMTIKNVIRTIDRPQPPSWDARSGDQRVYHHLCCLRPTHAATPSRASPPPSVTVHRSFKCDHPSYCRNTTVHWQPRKARPMYITFVSMENKRRQNNQSRV